MRRQGVGASVHLSGQEGALEHIDPFDEVSLPGLPGRRGLRTQLRDEGAKRAEVCGVEAGLEVFNVFVERDSFVGCVHKWR